VRDQEGERERETVKTTKFFSNFVVQYLAREANGQIPRWDLEIPTMRVASP